MSVVCLIVATWSSSPPASGNIIKEMPGSVASGTPYTKAPVSHLCPSATKVTSQLQRKLLSVTVPSNVRDILLSLTCRQSNV